jgi:hypothetical protein
MSPIDRRYSTKPQEPEPDDTAAQIAAFLAAGGTIKQCPPCTTTQSKPETADDDE